MKGASLKSRAAWLLGIVVLVVATDWGLSGIHHCHGAVPGQQFCAEEYYGLFRSFSYQLSLGFLDWVKANNALIAAVATVVIAWFTVLLARVGRQQISTTEILQRAYLSVEPAGVSAHHERWRTEDLPRHDPATGEWPQQSVPHVTIKNAGRLPARNIAWAIEHKFCSERYLNNFPRETLKPEGEATLTSGGEMRQGGKIINVGNDDGELRFQPERFLYVWGVVTYDDGFAASRETRFCHRYNCGNVETIYGEKIQVDAGGKGPVIGAKISAEFARVHRYGNGAT